MLFHSLYVVRLLCVEYVDKNGKLVLYLVFEYLDTDLKKFIDTYRKGPNPRPMPPTLIQSFLYQLCKGMAYCHSHGVPHRDLKHQNLLVDKEKGILKIVDLGLGKAFTLPLKIYTHEGLWLDASGHHHFTACRNGLQYYHHGLVPPLAQSALAVFLLRWLEDKLYFLVILSSSNCFTYSGFTDETPPSYHFLSLWHFIGDKVSGTITSGIMLLIE